MKTILIGLLCLGLTSLSYAQNRIETVVDAKSIKLKDVIISSNSKYMNRVFEDHSSDIIKNLEQLAAGYDIKENEAYSEKYDTYIVNFKAAGRVNMQVTYGADGIIQSSRERYDGIILPHSVRRPLFKDYPGYALHSNSYRVNYNEQGGLKKLYKVQIRKDGDKKNLKINVEGNDAIVSVDYD